MDVIHNLYVTYSHINTIGSLFLCILLFAELLLTLALFILTMVMEISDLYKTI